MSFNYDKNDCWKPLFGLKFTHFKKNVFLVFYPNDFGLQWEAAIKEAYLDEKKDLFDINISFLILISIILKKSSILISN